MAILKRCLTPEIRDGLGDSLSSPALYSEALKELESTYGHPSLISRTYFQSLIQLQRVNNNDYNFFAQVFANSQWSSRILEKWRLPARIAIFKSAGHNHHEATVRDTKQVGETHRQESPCLSHPPRLFIMVEFICQRRNDG